MVLQETIGISKFNTFDDMYNTMHQRYNRWGIQSHAISVINFAFIYAIAPGTVPW